MEFETVSPEFITAAYLPNEAEQVIYDLYDKGEKLGSEAGLLMSSKRVTLEESLAVTKASTIYLGIETADLILDRTEIYSKKIQELTLKNAAVIGIPITEYQATALIYSACYRTLMCLMTVVVHKVEGEYKDNYTERQVEEILNRTKASVKALDNIRDRAKPELAKVATLLKNKRLSDDTIYLIYQACFVNRLTALLVKLLSVEKFFFVRDHITADVAKFDLHLTTTQAENLSFSLILQIVGFMCELPGNSMEALTKLKKLNRSKGFGS